MTIFWQIKKLLSFPSRDLLYSVIFCFTDILVKYSFKKYVNYINLYSLLTQSDFLKGNYKYRNL